MQRQYVVVSMVFLLHVESSITILGSMELPVKFICKMYTGEVVDFFTFFNFQSCLTFNFNIISTTLAGGQDTPGLYEAYIIRTTMHLLYWFMNIFFQLCALKHMFTGCNSIITNIGITIKIVLMLQKYYLRPRLKFSLGKTGVPRYLNFMRKN